MALSTLTPTVATDALSPVRPVSIVDDHLYEKYWNAIEMWLYFFALHNYAACDYYQQKTVEALNVLTSLGYTGVQAEHEFLQAKYAREEADELWHRA